MDKKDKWSKIAKGDLPDDYTNHAYSHFGGIALDAPPERNTEREKEVGILRNNKLSSIFSK